MTDDADKRGIACELEDLLIAAKFHTNGFIKGQPSSLGTYGGVLHYDVVVDVVNKNRDKDWASAVEVWKHDFESTGSPTFNMLACEVERLIEEETEETQTPATEE